MKFLLCQMVVVSATLIGNIWIEFANAIPVNPPTIPQAPVNRASGNEISPNISINLSPTIIFGEVEIKFGKNTKNILQCNNLTVVLFSDEKLVSASNQIGSIPMFSNSNALSGDLKTGKCNYQVSTELKYIGKKAKLEFKSNGYTNSRPTSVTIPKQQLEINKKVTLTKIS